MIGIYRAEFDWPRLTMQQLQAIPLVAVQKSDVEVAQTVGVTRETVNRWRNHDPDFIKAVLDHRKQLVVDMYIEQSSQSDELLELFDAFRKYLPKKYYRLAMSYFKPGELTG